MYFYSLWNEFLKIVRKREYMSIKYGMINCILSIILSDEF
ncbi:hypothetical protein HMPREF1065_03020 [Phocaeicola dorei CL03T12C01]|uniref:Uncharacterized protein n=1 Tax=Phocaeicola dorei CL03T12C01 TaxID=997877 RepID=I9FP83_9BACT|nr:hypothetical protein HMPREF1065_03020 [Phocaeicola dorei CL03T12C01]